MFYSGVLIQTATEALRNKRLFASFYSSISVFKGVIFIFNSCTYSYQSTFSKTRAVIQMKIDNFNEFAYKQLQLKKTDLKSEYLFRPRSVATNLVTSLALRSNSVLLRCVFLAISRTVP